MKPLSLSASAALVFEGCEARFKATYVDRAHDLSGEAANLGTACHAAIERWVNEGLHFPQQPFHRLIEIFDEEYAKLFSHNGRRQDGRRMLENWYMRSGDDYWENRTVLSTEQKRTFYIKTPDGDDLPVNYIFDRMDSLKNGTEVEVVDYKSVAVPIQPEELKERIQPRVYGLAAQIEFPDAVGTWVTFDLLRYETVSAFFTREDNAATWRYLKSLVQRIWDSDGTHETLNPECRWCIRKLACQELIKHQAVGGPMMVTDLATAVDLRAKLDWASGALRGAITDLDDFILEECENDNLLGLKTDNTVLDIKVTGRREVDTERIAPILGPDIMSRYGTIGVTTLDQIMKDEDLTDDQMSQLRQLTRKRMGKPTVKTKPIHPFDSESD